MNDYKEKYLKYKSKYLELKKKLKGGVSELKCVYCESDWIFKTNPAMCQECYNSQHESVIEYHKLQDEAQKLINKGYIDKAISKLEEVIRLRKKHANKWFRGGDESHNRFANQFLPNLINLIRNNPKNAINIWNDEFAKLAEPMQ